MYNFLLYFDQKFNFDEYKRLLNDSVLIFCLLEFKNS